VVVSFKRWKHFCHCIEFLDPRKPKAIYHGDTGTTKISSYASDMCVAVVLKIRNPLSIVVSSIEVTFPIFVFNHTHNRVIVHNQFWLYRNKFVERTSCKLQFAVLPQKCTRQSIIFLKFDQTNLVFIYTDRAPPPFLWTIGYYRTSDISKPNCRSKVILSIFRRMD